MKNLKQLLLVTLFTFCIGKSFSQTADSLSVFPNPFSSSTNIHFELAQSDTITLQVFNLLGMSVKDFYQSTVFSAGSYDINFSGDSLPYGIYMVRLKIGSTKNLTRKAVKGTSATAIADLNPANKILVFPNPTHDELTIPVNGNKLITITDLNGKIVKTIRTDQQVISLSDLRTGNYFITIRNSQNQIISSQKIRKEE